MIGGNCLQQQNTTYILDTAGSPMQPSHLFGNAYFQAANTKSIHEEECITSEKNTV